MIAVEPAFVGLLLAGIGAAMATRPRDVLVLGRSLHVASPGTESGRFGVVRCQAYGLCLFVLGLVIALVPLFLP